ncbi:hypothetical protein P618_200505 [Holospora obtusa F1]|uniref:Uncharacterized protein n=1 Tax=Holospora obtusa F1 TaxID=1399147 RepID=W6TU25_HOLOB|nr:hypothetical protein P618_200505 [Holospora obtusa F1]
MNESKVFLSVIEGRRSWICDLRIFFRTKMLLRKLQLNLTMAKRLRMKLSHFDYLTSNFTFFLQCTKF